MGLKQTVQRFVAKSQVEEFFVSLRQHACIVRKLIPVEIRHKFPSIGVAIPGSASYPRNDSYTLVRDQVRFLINRSDYVQWRLFYGVRDNALKAAKKHLTKNTIVLDVGSNFGAFSLKLAAYIREQRISDVHIHAFEPNLSAASNFKNNLSLNSGFEEVVTLHHYGLGNATSTHSFKFDVANTGAGRIIAGDADVKVAIRRLDDVMVELGQTRIGFIKMIAEGYEPMIFEGAWNTIIKHRPPIFFEVTPAWWLENHAAVKEILDRLRSLGYSFSIEHFNEMVHFNEEKFKARTQYNLLATIQR